MKGLALVNVLKHIGGFCTQDYDVPVTTSQASNPNISSEYCDYSCLFPFGDL
jgi:hypothetical protein